jgi:hypothetical protein
VLVGASSRLAPGGTRVVGEGDPLELPPRGASPGAGPCAMTHCRG